MCGGIIFRVGGARFLEVKTDMIAPTVTLVRHRGVSSKSGGAIPSVWKVEGPSSLLFRLRGWPLYFSDWGDGPPVWKVEGPPPLFRHLCFVLNRNGNNKLNSIFFFFFFWKERNLPVVWAWFKRRLNLDISADFAMIISFILYLCCMYNLRLVSKEQRDKTGEDG